MHYENQILDAIEKIVDSKINNAGYDKTIQATIVKCEDATIGKYKISYQDGTFYAYANSSEISYAEGADVYILVPNGDMSRDKTILGSTKKLGKDYATAAIGEDAFEIVGTNCIDSHASFELCSYETTLARVIYNRNESVNPLNINVKNLEEYIKESTSITLAATIRTNLPVEQQFRGNYGIVYQMVFDDNATGEEVLRNYVLDINQFEGNPYNYPNWKRQFGIFEADGKNFKYLSKVYLFCYDFPNQESGERPDIFIENLELYGVVALTENDLNSFKLSFITTQGTFFDNSDDEDATRLIEAKVRVKGKYIDNKSQILPYYWFIENNGITSLSEDYCSYGGQGWKCLNKKNVIASANAETGAAPVVEWVPGNYQFITAKKHNQAKETRYKCVVLYNNITLSREITITNYSSQWDLSIVSDSGTEFFYDIGNPSLTCFVNNRQETGSAYTYQWAEVNSKNNFYSLPNTTDYNTEYDSAAAGYASLQAQIAAETAMPAASQAQLNAYLQTMKSYDTIRRVQKNKIFHLQVNTITAFTTYKCSVYHEGIYIGTASIVLRNRLDKKDLYTLVINNGVQTFKYDEQGVAPTSKALDNPQIIPVLNFSIFDNLGNALSEDIISRCKIKWSIPITNTLIETTETGTIEGDYLIVENQTAIAYTIKQKYDVKKNNNNIQLTVEYKDMNLVTRTDLTFAKEGEPGTNGTEFLCKIVPNSTGDVLGYPMLLNGILNYTPVNSDKWFRVQLWHSGDKIFDSITSGLTEENKQATVKWEILKNKYKSNVYDASSISVTEQGSFAYTGYAADSSDPADIIKCTIRYEGVDYYCTMPMITATAESGYGVELVENTGFRFATYSADGRSPQFDNSIPFTLKVTKLINGYVEDISTLQEANGVNYTWAINGVVYSNDLEAFINKHNLGEYNRTDIETITDNQYSVKPLEDYDGECLSNAIECIIKNKSNQIVAKIHIPIHLLLNKYGHAALNDWDGNHVSIDKNGSGVILAPQVGAGQKETDNSFTGMLIGKVKEANHKNYYTGLHGYNHGIRTVFINSGNGSAIFGKQGIGQIIIDPVQEENKDPKALIYSSNYWKNYNEDGLPRSYNNSNVNKGEQDEETGMLIDLSTPEIKFANENFSVDKYGYITAKGGGHIAGWKIDNYKIHSDDGYTVGRTGMNSVYTVNGEGSLTEKVYTKGQVSTKKAIAFWAGGTGSNIGQGYEKFMVSHDGYVKMEEASIGSKYSTPIYIGKDANDNNSAIYSGSKNQLNGLAQNGFYLGTDGIGFGYLTTNGTIYSKFQVSQSGDVYAPSISIRVDNLGSLGTIGHFLGSLGDGVNTNCVGIQSTKNSIIFEATSNEMATGNIRLTSKRGNIYLDAQYSSGSTVHRDVFFKTGKHKDKWYSLGTAFFS